MAVHQDYNNINIICNSFNCQCKFEVPKISGKRNSLLELSIKEVIARYKTGQIERTGIISSCLTS